MTAGGQPRRAFARPGVELVSVRATARRVARSAWRLAIRSDVAVAYAVVLVIVTIVLVAMGGDTYRDVVQASSTNLSNLRRYPWAVLITSAFVVSSPWGLWQVPFLMLAYGAAQRWVGRVGAVVVGAIGHVGATLVVATFLSAGISRGWLVRRMVEHEVDVGFSYGLACVAAFLVTRVPRRWRVPYVVVLVGYFVGPVVFGPTFTEVGHTVALSLGFLLALLVQRAGRAP